METTLLVHVNIFKNEGERVRALFAAIFVRLGVVSQDHILFRISPMPYGVELQVGS